MALMGLFLITRDRDLPPFAWVTSKAHLHIARDGLPSTLAEVLLRAGGAVELMTRTIPVQRFGTDIELQYGVPR